MNHFGNMTLFMLLAGVFSTMNMWADSIYHIRFSLNDAYMISLMTGWMLLFMSIFYKRYGFLLISSIVVILSLWAIRTQAFIGQTQFLRGMIPHHSMAIHMSKRLLEKGSITPDLLNTIIRTQENEIEQMKKILKSL